jgi:hypothetical protein
MDFEESFGGVTGRDGCWEAGKLKTWEAEEADCFRPATNGMSGIHQERSLLCTDHPA